MEYYLFALIMKLADLTFSALLAFYVITHFSAEMNKLTSVIQMILSRRSSQPSLRFGACISHDEKN